MTNNKNTYVLDARTANNHFPGIGRYVVNLAREMISLLNKFENLILLHDPSQPSFWQPETLTHPQLKIINTPISPFSLKQQWVIPKLLQQLNTTLYHSPYYLMPYRPNKPTLLTVYDFIPLIYPQYFSVKTRILYRLTVPLALKVAKHITVISQATQQDLHRFYQFDSKKVTPILLAADANICPALPQSVITLKKQLNLPNQYVLYFGSNKPHKNLERLIKAFAQIQPQAMPLVIAGVWDKRYNASKELIKTLNLTKQVYFLGPMAEKDIHTLYSGATVFVFPSEYEGFGLPILEAMACGTPVACANTSSLTEIAGDAALLFDPTDVDAIANALNTLIGNEDFQKKLSQKGFQQTKQFSWQKTAQKTLTLYRQMCQ